ncbi:hypothetical protein, partial [Thiolapillus sp.]|uniref:hypothetical protein n=1 Tax=Thiolapillus sp. TaxID=2017437 RepID=UPI0025EB9943
MRNLTRCQPWRAKRTVSAAVTPARLRPFKRPPSPHAKPVKTPCQGVERRTRIDIIFEKVVTHVDAEIKQCPQCRTRNKG